MACVPLTCFHPSSSTLGAKGTVWDDVCLLSRAAPSHQPRLKQPPTAKATLEKEASSLVVSTLLTSFDANKLSCRGIYT